MPIVTDEATFLPVSGTYPGIQGPKKDYFLLNPDQMERGGSRLGQSTWKGPGVPYHILTFLIVHTKHTLCPTSLFVSMHLVEAESCPIVLFGGSDTVFQFSQLFSNSVAAKLSSF